MKSTLLEFLRNEIGVHPEASSVLLAVSGGIDSMVMMNCLSGMFQKVGVAHCNFLLRGEESDQDELFVKKQAEQLLMPFYSTSFDTATCANDRGISIQMAARELRYQWLEEVRQQQKYDYIAVAHHQDDAVETFFINLLRGTGLGGLSGIKHKNAHLIRPFLGFLREEIEGYAKEWAIPYREDSSNQSEHYQRNKIRRTVLPILKTINPSLTSTLVSEMQVLDEINTVFRGAVKEKMDGIVEVGNDGVVKLNKVALERLHPLRPYLYEFLKDYGYNAADVDDVLIGFQKTEKAEYFSSTHRLIRNREDFYLVSRQEERTKEVFYVPATAKSIAQPFQLSITFEVANAQSFSSERTQAFLTAEKLTFPLKLRKWNKGDTFYPLGMKGKKKVSDFLSDQKCTTLEKEATWVLVSEEQIVWVVGHRIDERFRLTKESQKMVVFNRIEDK
jgi:tRNA(Ile)-lysidine synthase